MSVENPFSWFSYLIYRHKQKARLAFYIVFLCHGNRWLPCKNKSVCRKTHEAGRTKNPCTCLLTSTGALQSSCFISGVWLRQTPNGLPLARLLARRRRDYFICAATSAAKSSFFFSRPSPVSKRTNFFKVRFAPFSFATCAMYCATVCLPSSALTYT